MGGKTKSVSPKTGENNRSSRKTGNAKKRRRRVIAYCILFVVVIVLTIGILFGVKAIARASAGNSFQPEELVPEPQPEVEPSIEETEPIAPIEPTVYEEEGVNYIDIDGTKVLIVNKSYALPADFGGEDAEANEAIERMFQAAAKDGISLFTVSGYRSYDSQASIHQGWIDTYGEEYAKKISAEPGHSEHQTGLAFDINSLSTSFCETDEYRWLIENCAEYGFIERYLEDKVWATGYNYEPWHYRYIGDAVLAQKIMDSGLSLEEYVGITDSDAQ